MIIDSHMHAFPYLGGESGWGSVSAHLAAWQKWVLNVARPKAPEGSAAQAGMSDINFRVGKFGRFEWTEGEQDYYLQFMPPGLQEQTASPEFVLAQMDHAGVDMAVLQNAKLYGKLNEYFADCVKRYPDKFIGLAEIDEARADEEGEILRLRHCVKDLGLNGIYYEADRFFQPGNSDNFNDKKFDSFWHEVESLDIPVYWSMLGPRVPREEYLERMRLFAAWRERFPEIPSVIVMGLCGLPFRENGQVKFPEALLDICKLPKVWTEITYPIQAGPLTWDYPFPEAQKLVRYQYEELGAERLVWGSDMPNVERNCTYRQSLTFLKDYCDFISPGDMDLILGGNMARLHKIRSTGPETPRPKPAVIA